jgi:hypothetical protein
MPQGFKYSKQYDRRDNGLTRNRDYCNLSRIDNNCSHNFKETASFFIRPRLKIDKKISAQHVTINVNGTANGLPTPTETFKGIVWNFKIENRRYFTGFVEGCTGEVFMPNLDYRVQMTWQRPSPYELPKEYPCGSGLPPGLESYRHEYQIRLGVEYTGSLVLHGRPTMNFPKSSSRELHFLFTFPESRFAHIISNAGIWNWYDNETFANRIGDVFLVLEIPGTYDIHLTLGHDHKIHRYQLELKKHDDISIKPVRF